MPALQDNTIADSPMVELLTSMQHMLEQARVRTMGVGSLHDLHQLVIIVADGRFHEKESLQRVVAVRPTYSLPWEEVCAEEGWLLHSLINS